MNTQLLQYIFCTTICLLALLLALSVGCGPQPNSHESSEDKQTNEVTVAESDADNGVRIETKRKSLESDSTSLLEAPDQVGKHLSEGDDGSSDARNRKLILGTWQDNYKGKRTMTFREDGTATMIVEPTGLAATLYAERMTFEEEWQIDEGRLKLHATGGEPKIRVNLVLKTMGNTSDYKILELTQVRMLLEDKDGKTKFDWQRIDE